MKNMARMTRKICVRGIDPSNLEHLVFLSSLIDRRTWNEGTGSDDATAKGNAIDRDMSVTDEPAASGNQTTMIIDRIRVVGTDLFAGSRRLYSLYLLLLSRFRIIRSERPYYRILYFSTRLAGTIVSLKVIIRRILNEFTTRRVYNAIRHVCREFR